MEHSRSRRAVLEFREEYVKIERAISNVQIQTSATRHAAFACSTDQADQTDPCVQLK